MPIKYVLPLAKNVLSQLEVTDVDFQKKVLELIHINIDNLKWRNKLYHEDSQITWIFGYFV